MNESMIARVRALHFSQPEETDQPRTMGWAAAITTEEAVRHIGGVAQIRRYRHEDGGSYYGVIWWFRLTRYFWCDEAAFTRWLYTTARLPVPAWVGEVERLRA